MFAGEYKDYADYVRKHREFFPEVYEPEEEEETEEDEETAAEFMQRVYHDDFLRGKK